VVTLPRVALLRSTPTPGLVLLDGRGSSATQVADGDVVGCAWAPGAPILAYQRGADLCIYNPHGLHETMLSALPSPVRRSFAFNPRGDGLAVLADGALFLLPVLDSFGSGHRVPLPADEAPIDIQWFRGGSAVAVACQREDRRSLIQVDLTSNEVRTFPGDCELLAARRSDDRLIVRRLDRQSGEDEAGVLDDDGSVVPLFRVPEGLFISSYLAGPDLFLVAESSEDAGDPTALFLVMPGGLPGQPWLHEFPLLADWTFTPDGMFLTGLARSNPEEHGELIVASVEGGPVSRIAMASFAGEDEQYGHPVPADAR
jgi:hypothetical protein